MQRRTHAALGATTLTTTWSTSAPRPVDAARSIELVGTTSESMRTPSDPITAARRWLSDPARGLEPELRSRAELAVDVAEQHLHLLDELASELAIQVDSDGSADPARIAHVDTMAAELISFSDRLRTLLDPDARPGDALDRLERGLEAASSGGLRALVAVI